MGLTKTLLVSSICLVFAFSTAVRAQNTNSYCLVGALPNGSICTPMLAGQFINVGQTCINVLSDKFVITTTTNGDWKMSNVKAWAGLNLADLPTTNSGNPIPGQFPYSCIPSGNLMQCVINVPFTDIYGPDYDPLTPCNDVVFFAVHADVFRVVNGTVVQQETAWGNGTRIVDKGNWGTYFTVLVSCDCEQGPPPGNFTCETAFAKSLTYSRCFLLDGFNRWGWTNGPLPYGSYTFELWAGAGQCDLSKGTLVGTVLKEYTANAVHITYMMFAGYGLQETHVYIGSQMYPLVQQGKKMVATVAPGQYPYQHQNLNNATIDTYNINEVFTPPIWEIDHAVVCWFQ